MRRRKMAVWTSLAVSLAGVVLVAAFLAQPVVPVKTETGLIAWAVFSTICLLGAVATLFPHYCNPSLILPDDLEPSRITILKGVRFVHGHHPTCGRFDGHEFVIGGKTYCAGCTGLLVGALSSFSVATINYFYHYRPPAVSGYIGLGFVALGLLYIPILKAETPLLRATFNALFVLGFALVLVAVNSAGNAGFELIVIGLSSYWMLTRIQLSRWSHDATCGACDEVCDKKVVLGS